MSDQRNVLSGMAREYIPRPTQNMLSPNVLGLRQPGNLDINNRQVLPNRDGSISTERSISIGTDQGEVVIPTVVNGMQLSIPEAIAYWRRTGQSLGTFDTPQNAEAYANALHLRQSRMYRGR